METQSLRLYRIAKIMIFQKHRPMKTKKAHPNEEGLPVSIGPMCPLSFSKFRCFFTDGDEIHSIGQCRNINLLAFIRDLACQ